MSNRFDFELHADDNVSAALENIDKLVRGLQPELDKTRKGLALGGQDTKDGLTDTNAMFEQLGRFAKQNVQLLGDMVPPLRNFTGIASKMGKLGLMGGAAYAGGKAIKALGEQMDSASDDAYALKTAADNAGMSVENFSRMTGAMRILGTDSETARQSVEGLYKTFNDGIQARSPQLLNAMDLIGAKVVTAADGTADVYKTMENLGKAFSKLSANRQKTFADQAGFSEADLQLLRSGTKYKALLEKAGSFGLVVDPQVNKELIDLNRSTTELGAAWDGLKNKIGQKFDHTLLSGGSVSNGIQGLTDLLQNGPDNIALMHATDFNNTREASEMREGYKHPEFMKTLSKYEKFMLDMGLMTDGFDRKFKKMFGSKLPGDDSPARTGGTPAAPGRSRTVDPDALSVRNNNPWNIRYANQNNAGPGAKDFARFATPEDGVKAAERQLMLYYTGKSANVSHPLRTLEEIISTASPRKDHNNTTGMINGASSELNIAPDVPLNLADPQIRSRVLAALFNQEGNNPYSPEQIQNITQQGSPSIVRPPLPPAGTQTGGNDQVIKNAVAEALNQSGVKIELTLVDSKTGQRKSFISDGGSKVVSAMPFP